MNLEPIQKRSSNLEKQKHEIRAQDIKAEINQLNAKKIISKEELELSLELMQTMQNQWINLDIAKKTDICVYSQKKSYLEKMGKITH